MQPEIYHFQEILFDEVRILHTNIFHHSSEFTLLTDEEGIRLEFFGTPLWEFPFSDEPEDLCFGRYGGSVTWQDQDGEHRAYAKFCPYDMETDTGWLEVFALVPTERTGRKNRNPRRSTGQDGDSF